MKAKALFLSHGGGPLPLLGDTQHDEMVSCLKEITAKIDKPDAIIVVSAHWEANVPTITAGHNPALIYDYYGFPDAAYEMTYPCRGNPWLAHHIHRLLIKHDIAAELDEKRGFDHGLFVPLKMMYPDADIPCVQLSLVNNLDAKQHIAMGKALQSLAHDNVLVIGSGFSFHNMKAFFSQQSDDLTAMNHAFEDWLIDTCSNQQINEAERAQRLSHWATAPAAQFCHPRAEHLLPLHVCYGVAQTACQQHYQLNILGKRCSFYLW